jgi:general secretion pathway protein G
MNRVKKRETMKPTQKSRRGHGAFTLIELLLVMVILVTLATLVVPRFAGRAESTKKQAAAVDIKSNIRVALGMFETDCGRYPTTAEGLAALVNQPQNAPNWQGPYFENSIMPKDPWGNPYIYECPGQHNIKGYDLSSCGPDGQPGGGDDIDNWTQQ